jgi:hypothetical protein
VDGRQSGVSFSAHFGCRGFSSTRGHTSLTGAAEAQLAVKRDTAGNVLVTVEWMKDGPEGDVIVSRLEVVEEVGLDGDGDPIASCSRCPSGTGRNRVRNRTIDAKPANHVRGLARRRRRRPLNRAVERKGP